jgi:hypothetical protein
MGLSQQHLIVVTVDGRSLGPFDTRSGGEVTGGASKRRSAGMGPFKQRAGLPDFTDLTVTRVLDGSWAEMRRLQTRAGKAEMVVSDFTLDDNGQRFGPPITFTGKLQNVVLPDADSQSTDYAMVTLVLQVRSVS